jgi:hypothetical protein
VPRRNLVRTHHLTPSNPRETPSNSPNWKSMLVVLIVVLIWPLYG